MGQQGSQFQFLVDFLWVLLHRLFKKFVSHDAFDLWPGLLALVGPGREGESRSIRSGAILGGPFQSLDEVLTQIFGVKVPQGLDDCFVRVKLWEVVVTDLSVAEVSRRGPVRIRA